MVVAWLTLDETVAAQLNPDKLSSPDSPQIKSVYPDWRQLMWLWADKAAETRVTQNKAVVRWLTQDEAVVPDKVSVPWLNPNDVVVAW